MRVVVRELSQSHRIQRPISGCLARSVCVAAIELQGQAYVVKRRAPRQQRGVLKHEPDALAPLQFGRRIAAQRDVALAGVQQPADSAQQRGLAAAAWSYQRHKRRLRHIKAYPAQRLQDACVPVVAVADPLNRYACDCRSLYMPYARMRASLRRPSAAS